MPSRPAHKLTVTLPCPRCGAVVARAVDVVVECRGAVAESVGFTCPGCGERRSVPASAAGLALLHRAEVRVEERPAVASAASGTDPEPERQVVSLRVLLDDPGFLARMASAEPTTASREPAPAAPGIQQGAPDAGRTDA